MHTQQRRAAFRKKIEARDGLLIAGAFNALSARVIEDLRFEAAYLTGAGVNNMALGLPDLSFAGLSEIADHTARIRDVVDLPLVVDADTGFGNAINVRHTVKVLERSGADAIQLEDQHFPKRCGHFEGKSLIETAEMVAKIKAAVDARSDPNLLIVGRTDACGVSGFEDALDRAGKFAEAGADILFVEAIPTLAQIQKLPAQLQRPLLINIVLGGKTPVIAQAELARMRYGLVLYANTALQGALLGMQRSLEKLKVDGYLEEDSGVVASFPERQRLVGKPAIDALSERYVS